MVDWQPRGLVFGSNSGVAGALSRFMAPTRAEVRAGLRRYLTKVMNLDRFGRADSLIGPCPPINHNSTRELTGSFAGCWCFARRDGQTPRAWRLQATTRRG